MDVKHSRGPPGQQLSRPTTARKRGNSPSDTEDTELYSASGDGSSDDDFIPVRSKRARRKIVNAASKKATEDSEKIVLRTRDGIVIPKVSKLRVLGMVLEASRSNGVTVDKIIT
ncbi:hypothetical protein MTO96_009646 [Rhipicephalus appendiculatus]